MMGAAASKKSNTDGASSAHMASTDATILAGSDFSRKTLDATFGSGFSRQGFDKTGRRERTVVPSMSPAVRDGRVLLNQDGGVDKRCAAFRSDDLVLDAQGKVSTDSPLVQSKEVVLDFKDSAHRIGFDTVRNY
jgi:hypothetical protein